MLRSSKTGIANTLSISAGDHQIKNAQVMVDVGAGLMVLNENITNDEMINALSGLLSDKKKLTQMGVKASSLYKPSALQDVVDVCSEYLNA